MAKTKVQESAPMVVDLLSERGAMKTEDLAAALGMSPGRALRLLDRLTDAPGAPVCKVYGVWVLLTDGEM